MCLCITCRSLNMDTETFEIHSANGGTTRAAPVSFIFIYIHLKLVHFLAFTTIDWYTGNKIQ